MYEEILADMGRMVINSMLEGDGQSLKGIIRMFDEDLYDAILGTYIRAGVELGSRIVVEQRAVSQELEDAIGDEVTILRELTDLQESTISQIEAKLASDVSAGKTTKEVTELIIDSGVFSPMRALRISRTMVGAGSSRGQFLSGVMVGATHKIWQTAGDSHVRDIHAKMNGEEVGINERFSNGGLYPVDPRLSAANRINCRCNLGFAINDMAKYNPDALEQGPNTQKYNETLTDIEKSISKEAIEHGYVLDKDGNIVLNKIGEKSRIDFTDEELKSFKDKILTHNHPSGQSFSMADIDIMAYYELDEIRAVSVIDEVIYSAKLNLPDDVSIKEFRDILYKKEYAYRAKTDYQITSGKMKWEDMQPTYWHNFWESLSEDLGYFEYKKGGV